MNDSDPQNDSSLFTSLQQSSPLLIDPFEITSSCIFLILGSITCYIYVKILLHHLRRGFKSHYQKIFLILSANDLVVWTVQYLELRLPTWGVNEWLYSGLQTGFVPYVIYYLAAFTFLTQYLGTLLVAVNRASALYQPTAYEKIWLRITWPLLFSIILFAGISSCLIFFVVDFYFYRVTWGYYLPIDNFRPEFKWLADLYYWFANLSLLLSFFFNLYVCWMLIKFARAKVKSIEPREYRFHLTTIVQFLVMTMRSVEIVICHSYTPDEAWFFYEFAPVFTDLGNFVPIWFLVFLSAETRRIIWLEKFKNSKSIQVSIVSISG